MRYPARFAILFLLFMVFASIASFDDGCVNNDDVDLHDVLSHRTASAVPVSILAPAPAGRQVPPGRAAVFISVTRSIFHPPRVS